MEQSFDPLLELQSIPIASILSRPESEDGGLLSTINQLPISLKVLISSDKTGAYVRGLLKSYDVEQQKTPQFSFIILEIIIGIKRLADLGALLSSELQIANDKSQKMAAELEHDLFAPVVGDMNQYLAAKKQAPVAAAAASARQAGATNVLNLKQQPRRPVPPPIPRPGRTA